MKDTILVTGGSGLIGSYTVKASVDRGDDVVVLDIKPPNERISWMLGDAWDKVTFIEGSISDDFPTLLQACLDYRIEKIFHAAAIFRGQYELAHPYYSFHVTVEGMLNVCEVARILGLGRIVFAGSVGEYIQGSEDASTEPLTEYSPMYHPTISSQPYSSSKKAATLIGMCYWQHEGVDWVNTRFSRVWGFGSKRATIQSEGQIIENAVDGIPTIIPEGQGDIKRGQTYAKDLARGVLLALDVDGQKLSHRIFNIGGDIMASDRDVATIVSELIPSASIQIGKGGVSRRRFSTQIAHKELGWKPRYDLQQAVKDYIDIYRQFKAQA